MPFWSEYLQQTLASYEASLLRDVAARLIKPRNQWPVSELIDRCVAATVNAAIIDRRFKELAPPARQLLALIGHSRQPRWNLGSLIELVMALGHAEGLPTVVQLFASGLLYPDLPAGKLPRLKSFTQWLSHGGAGGLPVFVHPFVAERAIGEELFFPEAPASRPSTNGRAIHEADGLEWPLRLAVLWQHLHDAPLRRTTQGDFFKRDADRLAQNPLLNAAPAESLADLPDPGMLAVALAEVEGVVQTDSNELHAANLPEVWESGLEATLASLWAALPRLRTWDVAQGWRGEAVQPGNPYASAYLLALLLLAQVPEERWVDPADIDRWVTQHHPNWSSAAGRLAADAGRLTTNPRPITTFLLGLAFQLRLIQAARSDGKEWLVRLSPTGRWLLGLAATPLKRASYPQTLMVQPNLEIVAYRQGLTPGLIARLSRFAAWKSLGSACLLQLGAETVYRALESGLTFDGILHTLEQHGMRPTPAAVVESLRTWAGKRERISIYPAATLLEFGAPEELNEALARGLPALRLSERLAVVPREADIDYRYFRLIGTRDYSLAPDKCVAVEEDGVTLTVDVTRSDLILETELPRFAEPVPCPATGRTSDGALREGSRQYRMTPASLAAARDDGWSIQELESWFALRTGQGLPPAARLLLTGPQQPPASLQRHLVLRVPSSELADGLMQWPETRRFVQVRLGPTALAIVEERADEFQEKLQGLGLRVVWGKAP